MGTLQLTGKLVDEFVAVKFTLPSNLGIDDLIGFRSAEGLPVL